MASQEASLLSELHRLAAFWPNNGANIGNSANTDDSTVDKRLMRRWMSELWNEATLQLTALFDRHGLHKYCVKQLSRELGLSWRRQRKLIAE